MTKFDRPTLITFTAPTCSGKSYLLNKMAESGDFSRIVSTTTRKRRPGEVEGVDYNFIGADSSLQMEANDEFFELITFNNTRYGVTHDEMRTKMASGMPPIVVLEPQGLEIYTKKCQEQGWGIFKVYVHVTESVRLDRLLQRTLSAAWEVVDTLSPSYGRNSQDFFDVASESAKRTLAANVSEHQRRLLSITGDERTWSNRFSWDAIVPGDDVAKAVEMIKQGIRWRNHKEAPPKAIGAVKLPL